MTVRYLDTSEVSFPRGRDESRRLADCWGPDRLTCMEIDVERRQKK
jgi:hypothetical protein